MGFFLRANSLIVQKIARQIVAFWRASRQTNRQKVHFRPNARHVMDLKLKFEFMVDFESMMKFG